VWPNPLFERDASPAALRLLARGPRRNPRYTDLVGPTGLAEIAAYRRRSTRPRTFSSPAKGTDLWVGVNGFFTDQPGIAVRMTRAAAGVHP
jgi:hypothetical protein